VKKFVGSPLEGVAALLETGVDPPAAAKPGVDTFDEAKCDLMIGTANMLSFRQHEQTKQKRERELQGSSKRKKEKQTKRYLKKKRTEERKM
jgi:hypothetical protein